MLIACVGPDVYRALEKARELEAAFRLKYDLEGSSIEQLHQDGTELIDEVVERVNTVSLFTPRRFLRVRDLLKGCPKGRVGALEKALSVDPENVIVVTVESDVPPDATLKVISTIPKWIRYDFGTLEGRAMETWVRERATSLKLTLSEEQVSQVAERADGDTWQAAFSLISAAAGAELHQSASMSKEAERSLFDWADAYLKQDPSWRVATEELGPDTLLYPFLSQQRSYQRVKSGQDSGIPSFVVRKLQGLRTQDSEERFARLLEALMLQRQGFAREDELGALF